MKKFRRLIALVVFLGVAWVTIPLLIGRDKEAEDRFVGALTFIQEIIEGSYATGLNADVFDSPSIQPQPQPNVWSLSGTVVIQDSAGTTIHEQYIAVIENLCQSYAERRCWRLERLTIGDAVLTDQKSTTRTALKMELPGVTPSTDATSPVTGKAGTVLSEAPAVAPSTDVTPPVTEKVGTQLSEAPAVAPSTDATPPAVERAGPQLSEAPRAAPSSSISMSSTAEVRTQREENLVLLVQMGLKEKGLDPGPLDGLMGPRTRGAIETYQQRNNLAAHGQPTKSLLDHLRREPRGQDKQITIQFVKVPGVAAASQNKGATTKTMEFAPSEPTALPAAAALGAGSAGFGVELSSLGSADETVRKRVYLKQIFPDLLGDTELPIVGVDLGERGIFYRVLTKPFPDRLTANYVCARIRARKQYCRVVPLNSIIQAITIAKTTTKTFTNRSGTQPSITQTDGLSYAQAGVVAQNKGDLEGAIDFYSLAIESGELSQEDSARVYNNRGAAYKNAGFYDLAIEDYNSAIRLKKDYARAHYNRAIAYSSKGLFDLAIEDYSTTTRMNPSNARAYNNRGLAYDKFGQYDQAIADFSQAIRLAPDLDFAYFNRGRSYQIKGDQQLAIKDFRKSYSLNPENRDYQAKMREVGLLQ